MDPLRTHSADSEEGKRKRMRQLKSCLVCRQKKTKCDKVKPICGSCQKRKNSSQCHYEETSWSVNVADHNSVMTQLNPPGADGVRNTNQPDGLTSDISRMNERINFLESALRASGTGNILQKSSTLGVLPPADDGNGHSSTDNHDDVYDGDTFMSFYRDSFEAPGMSYQGALSWVSLLRKDVYLNCVVMSTNEKKTILSAKKKEDSRFSIKYEQEMNLNVEFNNEIPPQTSLLSQIRNTLKDKKLVWILVEKFFTSELYAALPVLDKYDFTSSLFEILGLKTNRDPEITIKRRFQFTSVGILLLVMRLASLSMYNVGKPHARPVTEEEQYIIDNPIPYNVVKIVDQCQIEVEKFKEPSFGIFQLSLLRILYDFYAPEDCDCATVTTSVHLGRLLHLAVQCRTNRDPLQFCTTIKNRNLIRRMWYMLVQLDFHQLVTDGCPSIIDAKYYNTELPHLDESESPEDYAIDSFFHCRAKIHELCYPLLMSILNVRVPVKVSTVNKLLLPIEKYADSIPRLPEIMARPRDTVLQRSANCQTYSALSRLLSFTSMIYYHLFLHYNCRKDHIKSLNFILKMLSCAKDLYSGIFFLDNKMNDFNPQDVFGCAIAVIPKIEMYHHRFIQILFALMSRIKAYKGFQLDCTDEMIDQMDVLMELCTKLTLNVAKRFIAVSDMYYHTWVVSKIHIYIVKGVLSVPKGRDEAKREKDLDFFKTLNEAKYKDDVFFRYNMDDFKKIERSLRDILELDIRYAADIDDSPLNTDFLYENDKRWFDQLLYEMNGNMKDFEQGEYGDGVFGEINVDGIANPTQSTMGQTYSAPNGTSNNNTGSNAGTYDHMDEAARNMSGSVGNSYINAMNGTVDFESIFFQTNNTRDFGF